MAGETKPQKSIGCCLLKIFLALSAVAMLVALALGIVAWRTVSWFTNVAEPAPAVYAPLNVSSSEQKDVDRIIQRLQEGQRNPAPIDEYVSPTVFNAVIDRIVQGERDQGKQNELEALRLDFDGDHFKISFSSKFTGKHKPAEAQQYLNVEASFDLEIEDGKINKSSLASLTAGGREAPFLVHALVNNQIQSLKRLSDQDALPNMEKLRVIKLLKREKNRVHVILDPAYFDGNNGAAEAPAVAPRGKKKKNKVQPPEKETEKAEF